MKEHQDLSYPKKELWEVFVPVMSSQRNPTVNQTKAGLMRFWSRVDPAWKVEDPQETRCLGSSVIIHLTSHSCLGELIIIHSTWLPFLGRG